MIDTPTKQEFSSGGCVYKKEGGEVLWLVGKHSGYHKWVLPKGKIEEGENEIETAIRETEEELGVVAQVIGEEPIHTEKYWYMAELKPDEEQVQSVQPARRVRTYQEDEKFSETKQKVKIYKTVTFYLMEYVSGDPGKHDFEMEDAGWFSFEEAMEKLAFEGEKKALEKARNILMD